MKLYYVYILECSDGTFYTGITNNLERRLNEHIWGINPDCYTHSRRPVKLVWHTSTNYVTQAIEYEKKIKKWSNKKKKALIDENWDELILLAKKKFKKK
jgi:putative endonuclease